MPTRSHVSAPLPLDSQISLDLLPSHFHFSRETMRNLGDGVILLDASWKIVLINPFVEEVLGKKEREVAGQFIRLYLEEYEVMEYLDDVVSTKEPVGGIELTLFSPTDQEYTVRMGISPVFSPDGILEGALILFDDITEMTNLRIQLSRQGQLITVGTLAGWVAHELRNPLTSINVHLELFLQELENLPVEKNKEITSLGRILQEEIGRLGTNLNEFLNFNRLPPLKREEVDINDIVVSVVEFMDAEAQQSEVYLDSVLTPDLPKIKVDVNQIHLVLVNLIKNGIQAIQGEGEITVHTEPAKKGVRIRVVDTGCGISKKNLDHIFDFLFSTKKNSSGLGLPIARKIITEHRGTITVKSEVGKGTEFMIDLPLK